MSEFISRGQVAQDRFAWNILGHKTGGFFLDIGAGHPTSYNNTYAFEAFGWRGICCDLHIPRIDVERTARMVEGDARLVHWSNFLPERVDYLSLDVDELSGEVLAQLLEANSRFSVITIEHDYYLRGPQLMRLERELLTKHGYELVCAKVLWEGHPFEDWWVDPGEIPADVISKFRCIEVEGSIAAK